MELAEIIVNDFGGAPVAEHNMPCAVCRENHAVLELDGWRFQPCWDCQAKGWVLISKRDVPLWKRAIFGLK